MNVKLGESHPGNLDKTKKGSILSKEVRWYVNIYINLWYAHLPRTDLGTCIGMCTYHIYIPRSVL